MTLSFPDVVDSIPDGVDSLGGTATHGLRLVVARQVVHL
jgi:hypothetical protein